ncbi:MAG: cytosine/adenosine deaminase-related metal-dependent hydrolase [Planctomycetota bacterium]|jgi:cytosine/adenosine deaminase-related metal-dependent hydrolase
MTILVNAHTHLYSGLVPFGMPAPDPTPENFIEILERLWWRLDRALDVDSLRASARYYVAQAQLAGTAAIIDHHESPEMIEGSLDILADACEEFSMPALLTYGATERNGGLPEARAGLAECERFIRDRATDSVKGLIGLHASFTVSDDTICEAANTARELGTVLHVHIAEDLADVEDAQERGYSGVIDRFEKLDALVPGSIFAHGVHLTAQEVERVASADCWLVHNPRSNANNRVGFARTLSASSQVALGTDGFDSDMQVELGELERDLDSALAASRLESGARLAAAWWSPQVLAAARPQLTKDQLDELKSSAQEQATHLWERMRALDQNRN